MNIGLLLPTWSGSLGGETPTTRDIVAFARLAEQVGFDSLWVSDHFYNEPFVDFAAMDIELPEDYRGVKVGAWECWTVMAALAVSTSRVQLGTLVSNTGLRNPALLARMIDTVDDLSEGRVIAGFGAGDFVTEHAAYGFPFERPIARFEEAQSIICPLLRGQTLTHSGEFYSTSEATLLPRGPRAAGPEILIGNLRGGPRMLRLVATYADIWNCMLPFSDSRPTAYAAAWQRVLAACERHGRDVATLARNVTVGVSTEAAAFPFPQAHPLTGSSTELAGKMLEFKALGVETLSMVLEPCTFAALEILAPALAEVRRSSV